MKLTKEEVRALDGCNTEEEWYSECDQIKVRRSGQYPPYLSREILDLYQRKFKKHLS
mgnify:FL=1